MGRKPKPFDAQMEMACVLKVAGKSNCEIAKELGVTEGTIRYWFESIPEMGDHYQKLMKGKIRTAYSKAMEGYIRDLDDKNPWIRQAAQRMFVERFGDSIMGADAKEVVVKISGGMPEIGMPKKSDE